MPTFQYLKIKLLTKIKNILLMATKLLRYTEVQDLKLSLEAIKEIPSLVEMEMIISLVVMEQIPSMPALVMT